MKPRTAFSLVLLCLIFGTGCPYSSKVPLAVPVTGVVDDRLVGRWVGIDSGGDSLHITVVPFNQVEYYVELSEKAGAPTKLRAFAFDLSGVRFLHLNELAPDRGAEEFSFARYRLSGESELAVRFVADKSVPKALAIDAGGLRKFLTALLSDPALDDPDTRLALRRSE